MVGAKGFEPSTSWSQTKRATPALRPESYPQDGAPGATRTPAPGSGGQRSIR
ncbi:uncharacterized protein METZ01_LOCUS184561 [marine metagenome]|uniref:Uncharacterized protein n=1 Tax=marine metagenome TaxID=408172 RepID=A0A382D2A0_9ZZZZ